MILLCDPRRRTCLGDRGLPRATARPDDPPAAAAREARARGGRAGRAADARRRADAADDARRARGAARAARGPLPRQPGRRSPLRAADRLADAAAEHCPATTSCSRRSARHRAAERAPRRAAGTAERFLLLHRRRVWNEREGRWMGWERKRGKLHELNRLLRGATDTTFVAVTGPPPAVPARRPLRASRSTPTRGFPRDAARRLVGDDGASAEPAALRRRDGRVVEGYGILQPRVTPSLPDRRAAARSSSAIFSGPAASTRTRPRSRTSTRTSSARAPTPARASTTSTRSRRRSRARVPENTLLSHDLFEGIFARAGLVTDVELFEEFPSRYEVAAGAPASLGARRLAAAALDPRPGATAGDAARSRHRPLEDVRQPAPQPRRARSFLLAGRRPGRCCRCRAALWTGFVLGRSRSRASSRRSTAFPRRPGSRSGATCAPSGTTSLSRCRRRSGRHLLAHQAWLMADAIVAHPLARLRHGAISSSG